MEDPVEFFNQVVALRLQIDRAKDARRSREHSAERLTWVSSQLSQPDLPPPRFHDEKTEDDELEDVSLETARLVRSLTPSMLTNLVDKKAGSDDFVTFIRAVLDISSPKTAEGTDRSAQVFDAIISQLGNGKEVGRQDDLIAELLHRVNGLADTVVAYLAERTLACCLGDNVIEGTCRAIPSRQALNGLLELLCKLVFRLHSLPKGRVDPDTRCKEDIADMDGEGFQAHVVSKICHAHWQPFAVLPLVSTIHELCSKRLASTSTGLSEAVEEKVLKQWHLAHEKDVPEVCTQLLTLCGSFCDRRRVIDSIIDHFEGVAGTEEELPMILGQVVSRVSHGASQDARLGADIIKAIEGRTCWTATSLSILLSLGRVKRFEKVIVEAIKKRGYLEVEGFVRRRESRWLTFMGDMCRESSFNNSYFQLQAILLRVCDTCKRGGWDLLIPILVKVGVRLADEHDMLNASAHPYYDVTFEPTRQATSSAIMSSIGVQLLARCFQNFALARGELIAEIVNRALVSESGKGALPFMRLTNVLSLNNQTSRIIFHDHSNEIKDLITLLPNISPRIACGILRGLAPGISLSSPHRDLRDHAMIVFRKALFQRELGPRYVAMFGILTCCQQSNAGKVPFSEKVNASTDDGQLLEAFGCLRRCLSQQCEIKAALYSALTHLPNQFRVELLLGHFKGSYEDSSGDTDVSPIRFDAAFDQNTGTVKEPLAALLNAICTVGSPSKSLIDTTNRMANASMPTFSLDKTSSFDLGTLSGCMNRFTANSVIETCEVLINYILQDECASSSLDIQSQGMARIASLWRVQRAARRLVTVVVEKEAADEAAKGPSEKKRKQKLAADAEDAENDDGDSKNIANNNASASVASNRGSATNHQLRDLPTEGSWLSEDSVIALLGLTVEQSSVGNMLEMLTGQAGVASVSGAAGKAPSASSAAQSTARTNMASLLSNLGFHSYMMNATKHLLKKLSRLVNSSNGAGSGDGANGGDRKNGRFGRSVAGTTSTSSSSSLDSTNAEMAVCCVGIKPTSPSVICLRLGNLIVKAHQKYIALEAMIEKCKESDDADEINNEELNESTETTAGKSSKKKILARDVQGNGSKKRAKMSAGAGAVQRRGSSTEAKSQLATAMAEIAKLIEAALENLKTMLVLVSNVSRVELASLVRAAFKITKNAQIPAQEERDSLDLHEAAHRISEICSENFARKRYACAAFCLDAIRCCLLANSNEANISPQHQQNKMDSARLVRHIKAIRQLIQMYPVKPGPLVKQVLKLYLELSSRVHANELGEAYMDLAEGISLEFQKRARQIAEDHEDANVMNNEEDNASGSECQMIRGVACSNAAVTVLIQELSNPCLEECERILQTYPSDLFGSSQMQTAFVARMESITKVLATLMLHSLPHGPVSEAILRCIIRTYKCFTKCLKGCFARKSAAAPQALAQLVQFIWKNLTPHVDERLRDIETASSQESRKKPNSKTSGNKFETLKEAKLIPDVVFTVEQYEVVLLKASKACISIQHLAKFVRRTTARDFKVDMEKLKEALDRDQDNDEILGKKEEEEEED